MYVLVTLGVYVILVLLLRRPGICLYLMVTVLLGYLASLGVTELVFQAPHTGPTPWVGLDWKVGFFLFVILVAVGEDYNIFLMSRVIEEEQQARGGRGDPAGGGAYRRDHQLVRPDHGRHVRLDAHGQPDGTPRARLRPGPGDPARHVPRPPDPGPGLPRPPGPVASATPDDHRSGDGSQCRGHDHLGLSLRVKIS